MVKATGLMIVAASFVACAAAAQAADAPAGAAPRPAAAPPLPYGPLITLEQAKMAVAAAEAQAQKDNIVPTLVVVDNTGAVVLQERGTGQGFMTPEVALLKARSAAAYRQPTAAMYDNTRVYPAGMVTGLGGVPIVVGGKVIGAIGTAGGPGDAMAKAGAAAVH